MIDFPNSPTVGQVFAAPNGVIYQWDGTLWKSVSQSGAGSGDFCAHGAPAISTSLAAMVIPNVLSGNSGNWYNPSTGRYTPPPGRYNLYTAIGAYNNGASIQTGVQFRKNGTNIGQQIFSSSPINQWGVSPVEVQVDANGTDYFEVWAFVNTGGATGSQGYFGAFPIPASPVPAPLSPGDFMAQSTATSQMGPPSTATWFTIKPASVTSGNTGNWYNSSTGVYTPPAGRYVVGATITFESSSSALTGQLKVRKNGVDLPSTNLAVTTPGANLWGAITTQATVDCNGTDTIDIQSQTSVLMSIATGCMWAFPLAGMQPASTPVGWRQLGRVVPTAGQATVDFTGIPPDINDLELTWDVTPQTNQVIPYFRFFDNTGTIDATAGHYSWALSTVADGTAVGGAPTADGSVNGSGGSVGICLSYGVATRRVGNVWGMRGCGTVPNIRDAARHKGFLFQNDYLSDDGVQGLRATGSGYRVPAGAITGVRLSWSTGNFAAGGAVTLWGSP